jgi:hypothetical protein
MDAEALSRPRLDRIGHEREGLMAVVRILPVAVALLTSSGVSALEPDQIFEKVSPSVVIVVGQTASTGRGRTNPSH